VSTRVQQEPAAQRLTLFHERGDLLKLLLDGDEAARRRLAAVLHVHPGESRRDEGAHRLAHIIRAAESFLSVRVNRHGHGGSDLAAHLDGLVTAKVQIFVAHRVRETGAAALDRREAEVLVEQGAQHVERTR
jgi:hypothetical protein